MYGPAVAKSIYTAMDSVVHCGLLGVETIGNKFDGLAVGVSI